MKNFLIFINGFAFFFLLFFGFADMSNGASTIPRKINYQGRLLNASGAVVTDPVVFRFSIWTDADFVVATDWTASGTIVEDAPDYIGWLEEQIVIPDSHGLFVIKIGAVNPLPDLDFSLAHFLQIDLKNQDDSDLSYEVLDPDSNDSLSDRKSLNSSPYAFNADQVDNADIGTGSGNLVILGSDGKFAPQFIPSSTYDSFFVIDADDSEAEEITLQFGETLSKTLSYNLSGHLFVFNDDLQVDGDLSLDGDVTAHGNIIVGASDPENVILEFGTSFSAIIRFNSLMSEFEITHALDFQGNEVRDVVIHKGTAFPTAVEGKIFFRTDLNRLYINVDGTGDGWELLSTSTNASTLGGLGSSQFLRSDDSSAFSSGTLLFSSGTTLDLNEASVHLNKVTNNAFTLDSDNTGGNVVLQFGSSLNETFSWNSADSRFEISDDLDFNQNQAINFVLENGTAFPSTPVVGQKFFRTDENVEYVYASNGWSPSSSSIGSGSTVYFSPQYSGATFFKDGSNNNGNMISDNDGNHNFYKWTSTKSTLQDYDIVLQVRLPDNFDSWQANSVKLTYRTDTGASVDEAQIDVSIKDTIGLIESALSGADDLNSDDWVSTNIRNLSGMYTPGKYIYIFVKMQSRKLSGTSYGAYVGEIELNYYLK